MAEHTPPNFQAWGRIRTGINRTLQREAGARAAGIQGMREAREYVRSASRAAGGHPTAAWQVPPPGPASEWTGCAPALTSSTTERTTKSTKAAPSRPNQRRPLLTICQRPTGRESAMPTLQGPVSLSRGRKSVPPSFPQSCGFCGERVRQTLGMNETVYRLRRSAITGLHNPTLHNCLPESRRLVILATFIGEP